MSDQSPKEVQYKDSIDRKKKHGLTPLGIKTSFTWDSDPKRLLFSLARYKFVSKMLAGKGRVLEIGCGDAFSTRLVQQVVGSLVATDFDPIFVDDANERMEKKWKFEARVYDAISDPAGDAEFDAAYCLDVIERIPKEDEDKFLTNICASLTDNGVFIAGAPSLSSQVHASELSKIGHVNCKDGPEMKAMLEKYFHNVFMFSMNDEVVHTGFFPMAHYLIGVGAGKKQ